VLRGLFVTGTDTGVGKTLVSAALMHRCRTATRVCYWKPVQTGVEQDDDRETVRSLGSCSQDELVLQGVRLPRPLSPHLAARLSGEHISLDHLAGIAEAEDQGRFWIVEGAGGVLVPINERDLMIDLVVRLGLPAVVVARTTLGTINHTLLTLAALRASAIPLVGVVMVGAPDDENRSAISTYGRVPVLGVMPILPALTPGAVAEAAMSLDLAQLP
jgi:dethiobiotin synthase